MEGQTIHSERIKAILDFWYGPDYDRISKIPEDKVNIWFKFLPETDKLITEKFKEDLLKMASGEYESWLKDRDGKLAAILLMD